MPQGEKHFREEGPEIDAALECELLLTLDPTNVPLLLTLCKILAAKGEYRRALDHCQEALEALPKRGPIVLSRRLRLVTMANRLKRALEKKRR